MRRKRVTVAGVAWPFAPGSLESGYASSACPRTGRSEHMAEVLCSLLALMHVPFRWARSS